jgi:hypothetical protein
MYLEKMWLLKMKKRAELELSGKGLASMHKALGLISSTTNK